MSISPGKKFLVIPSDMYDRMTKHAARSYQPEKNRLIKSEEEKWEKNNKMKLFIEKLSKFKSLIIYDRADSTAECFANTFCK